MPQTTADLIVTWAPQRWPRFAVGGLLGIAAYFAIPVIVSLFSL